MAFVIYVALFSLKFLQTGVLNDECIDLWIHGF